MVLTVPHDLVRHSARRKNLIRFYKVKNLRIVNRNIDNTTFYITFTQSPAAGGLKNTPPQNEAFTNWVNGVFFLKLVLVALAESAIGEKKTLLVVLNGSKSSTVSKSNMSFFLKEMLGLGIDCLLY